MRIAAIIAITLFMCLLFLFMPLGIFLIAALGLAVFLIVRAYQNGGRNATTSEGEGTDAG